MMEADSVVIHQAHFLPWLPYMAKIACSNKFVVLDNVQFKPRYYINRTKILVNDQLKWLTIPTNGSRNILTKDTRICFDRNYDKVVNSLKENYRNRENYDLLTKYIHCIEQFNDTSIINLNVSLINIFFAQLDMRAPGIYYSSNILKKETIRDRTQRTIRICQLTNSSTLINGFGGSITAHDTTEIKVKNIKMFYINKKVLFLKYKKYQQYGGLSFLDNLLSNGLNSTKNELKELMQLYSEELR